MKKLTTNGLVLTLSFLLAFHPTVILAMTESGAASSKTLSTKLTPPRKPMRPAPLRSQIGELTGQTSTLLPDGRLLLVGGQGTDGPKATVAIKDPRSGDVMPLSVGLNTPRAWHSATMLPDGRVLIVGGKGVENRTVENAEIIDLGAQVVEVISSPALAFARANHTATLLTDGRVLIVGGVSAAGQSLNRAELWDFKTKTATTLTSKLGLGRHKQKATLQSDGNVLIEGGVNNGGTEITSSEIFNTESLSFEPAGSSPTTPGNAYLAGSVPGNDASNVPIDTLIGLRFSRSLAIQTINASTITLNGPYGGIATRIVPAEGGRLAFLTPLTTLDPGTTYTVNFEGATEPAGVVVPALFSFTTAGDTGNRYDEEDWIPDAGNLRGDWRSKRVNSEAQSLPPLQAAEGVTALAGQVLTLNGRPLAGVSLQIGSASAQTDQTGRFLLTNVATGHQVMRLDGRPASVPGRTYGTFKIGVDITDGKTNLLGYTIWMPKLDTAHAVNIQSPTTKQTVITNPHIPGLELRLPAQTVIRDMDANTVTQLTITPIPTNQPPFPLPSGVSVPVFFTIQPGGSQVIPPRAQLIYPNYTNQPAGARIDFWNYDAEDKGWYVYGRGTVTPNGKQIIPDAGVVLYEFTGAMVSNPNNAPPEGPEPCEECEDGDPVDLATGLFVYSKTDLVIPDTLPLVLTRTYRPRDTVSRPFGIGATHPYELFIVGDTFPYTFADLILPDGGRVHYDRISPGTGFSDAVYEHTETPSIYYKTQIRYVGGRWHLTLHDGTVYEFPDAENAPTPRQAAMVAMHDRFGNAYVFTRDSNSNLTKITSPNGRYIEFTYDTSFRITQAKDNIGRTVNYTYDSSGRLWKVTDANGGVTEHLYDTSNRMTKITDPRGILYLTNQYDTNGRVIKQTQADSTFFTFAYTLNGSGQVTQTNVTDPRGNVRRVTFNTGGAILTDTYALGKPEQQTITYSRQAGTNHILSETDALGRRTDFTYDDQGNTLSITRLAGTSGAVTTSYTYDTTFSQLTSITDPLNHTVTFGLDALGNITSVTDPLNHQTTMTYNAAGQITSTTDALQNTVQFGYDSGSLTTVTDLPGRTVTRFIDDAGRILSIRNPLGQLTRYEYDGLNQIKKITDAQGGVTTFTYDGNGNLLTLKDARNNVTTYTYNNMDRLITRKDALLRTQSYVYDGVGNPTKFTDRRGKVANYTYDSLNRPTFAGFGAVVQGQNTIYESTINYTYDAGDRLTQTVDSVSGTITFGYDNLDRLTSQTTPQGTVSYTYDAAGRRSSMTVAGQPTVNYAYDNADRPTTITQGTNVVGVGFDNADRLTSLTLPNGLRMEYAYDGASRLTSVTYKNGTTVIGDLTYTYDAAGHRKNIGGSFARMTFPQPLASATYNVNNQVTQRGSTNLTYDFNGNLTSDGVNTYTWDARNQLASISGGLSASFSYDSFGRRKSRTVNGATTEYVFDGASVVQEKVGGAPSANMLMGGLDQTFMRTDASGARHFLTDGLNSTLGLTDAGGAISTQYTYEPFGQATTGGSASSNASQFTGRDNDGTGLLYYRSRYYSPTQQRFISEDTVGFSGGDTNLYAYVFNSPTNYTDSSGQAIDVAIDIASILYDIYQLATGSRKDRLSNTIALGADVVGALIPFLTGLGAAYRGARTAGRTQKLLGTARDNLLNAAQDGRLRNAIEELYRKTAKVGDGSSMDAYRFERATKQLLSKTGHCQKLMDRRKQLQKLLRDPNLSPSDRQIVKDLLINIQNALSGY
jgi:RHS repeat-associated protein